MGVILRACSTRRDEVGRLMGREEGQGLEGPHVHGKQGSGKEAARSFELPDRHTLLYP